MREQLVMRNGIVKTASAHAADIAKESGWQPIEAAPLNESVLIFIPSPIAEHYGAAIYRGLLKQSIGAKIWMVTGLHFGSDVLLDEYQPTHWMPLPDPPLREQG